MEKYTKFKDIPQFTSIGNYAADFPIDRLVKFIEEEEDTQGLQLNPDFQRGHVWTEEQQIEYTKFILRGGKTGRVIYLNNPSWHHSIKEGEYNEYVCVDGLQRITALKRFIHNEIRVFGTYYSDFQDSLRFMTDTIRVNVNDLKSKKEVLKWYIEMNDGGTPHTKKEINRVKEFLKGEK